MADHVVKRSEDIAGLDGRERPVVAPPHGGIVGKATWFAKRLFHELEQDNITDNGAMMAYYAILSLFPMLLFVVSLALLVLPQDTVLQGLAMATRAMPFSSRDVITTQVTALMKAANAGFAIGGATLALWGASRGASSLMGALNAMYNHRESRSWWKRQLIAVAVTLGVAMAVVIALALLVVGPAAGHWLADRFWLGDVFDVVWNTGRWVGAGFLVMVMWAVVYKFLPDTKAPFQIFTPGAIVGVLLWLGISYGFGVYLSYFNTYANTYGALGGAIIFLTWLWLSNMSLLFGAEINDVLCQLRGPHGPGKPQIEEPEPRGGIKRPPDEDTPDRAT